MQFTFVFLSLFAVRFTEVVGYGTVTVGAPTPAPAPSPTPTPTPTTPVPGPTVTTVSTHSVSGNLNLSPDLELTLQTAVAEAAGVSVANTHVVLKSITISNKYSFAGDLTLTQAQEAIADAVQVSKHSVFVKPTTASLKKRRLTTSLAVSAEIVLKQTGNLAAEGTRVEKAAKNVVAIGQSIKKVAPLKNIPTPSILSTKSHVVFDSKVTAPAGTVNSAVGTAISAKTGAVLGGTGHTISAPEVVTVTTTKAPGTTTLAKPLVSVYSTHHIACTGWSNGLVMMCESALAKAGDTKPELAKVVVDSITISAVYGVDDDLTLEQVKQGVAAAAQCTSAAAGGVCNVFASEKARRLEDGLLGRRLISQKAVSVVIKQGTEELASKANKVRANLQDASKLQKALTDIKKGFVGKPTVGPMSAKIIASSTMQVPAGPNPSAAYLAGLKNSMNIALANSVVNGVAKTISGPAVSSSTALATSTTAAFVGTATPSVTQTGTPIVAKKYTGAVSEVQQQVTGVRTPMLLIGLFVSAAIIAIAFRAARRNPRETRTVVSYVACESDVDGPLE